jgi:hypothetical protein
VDDDAFPGGEVEVTEGWEGVLYMISEFIHKRPSSWYYTIHN